MVREHNAKATIVTTPLAELEGRAVLETIEGADTLDEMMKEMLEHAHEEHHHHHEEGEECCGHEHHHHHEEGEECCGHDHHHHHEEECCDHEHHHHEEEHGHHHEEECCCGHHHDHHHHGEGEECCGHDHHHHHADEVFTSWGRESPVKFTKERIREILAALDSGEYGAILRAKGMVPGSDGTWIYFDYVPEEHDIRTGQPEVTGKYCVIGAELKEEKLEELFG